MKKEFLILFLVLLMSVGFAGAEAGDVLWESDLTTYASVVTVDSQGNIYTGDDSGLISKLDPTDGSIINQWTLDGGCFYYTNFVLSPDELTLYAVDYDHKLYAINTESMTKKWESSYETSYSSKLIMDSEGYLYFTDSTYVFKIDPADGSKVWSYNDWAGNADKGACSLLIGALNHDETLLACAYTDPTWGYTHVDFVNPETGFRVSSTYDILNPLGANYNAIEDYVNYQQPTFDQNGYLVTAGSGIDSGSYSIAVKLSPSDNSDYIKLGTCVNEWFGQSQITYNSQGDIIATVGGTNSIQVFDGTTHETKYTFSVTTIDGYNGMLPETKDISVMGDNNIVYVMYERLQYEVGQFSDSYIIAFNTVTGEVEWHTIPNFSTGDAAFCSMSLMANPQPQLLVGDYTGLKAYEISSTAPLWTFEDHMAGEIGANPELFVNQRIPRPIIEEEEDDDDNDYGAWLAWKLSQEKEVVEEILIEEVVEEEGITSAIFEQNVKDSFNWWWLLLIIALVVFGYGAKKKMEK